VQPRTSECEAQKIFEAIAYGGRLTSISMAFNEKDVDAMLELAPENVTWMSIAGENIAKEASDAGDLKSAMQDYFSSHPGSYSKITQIQSSGPWVTTLEQAGREIDGQFQGQCAYAMYELNDGLIESVWYFSAHTCKQTQ
jgi:hypothetical protein